MNFKKILPSQKFTLTSRLQLEEIQRRISEKIEPAKINLDKFVYKKSHKFYQGEVSINKFKITPIQNTWSRSSFVPIISGDLISYLGFTKIEIKMRLRIFVLVFMIFWLGFTGIAATIGIYDFSNNRQANSAAFIIPLTMFLFGILITYLSFTSEASKSKRFLEELFEAQENISPY